MLKQFFGASKKEIFGKIIFGIFLFFIPPVTYSFISTIPYVFICFPFQIFPGIYKCLIGDNACQIIFTAKALSADIIFWYFVSCISTLVFKIKLPRSINIILFVLIIFLITFTVIFIQFYPYPFAFGFINEGQQITNSKRCWPGMFLIPGAYYTQSGVCVHNSFVCAKCGNGICGPGENKCNCPNDCKNSMTASSTDSLKTYINTQQGFEFKYPNNLTLEEKSGVPTLTHEVFYPHPYPCDWKDGSSTDYIVDFNISLNIVDKDINSALAQGEGAEGANIEKANIDGLNGFKYMWGVEYCGYNYYYLSVAPQKTLVIKSPIVTEISPIMAKEEIEKYLKIPGIITNTQAESLLSQIISTFKLIK